jgi:DNA mismatch repair protein MSH6
VELQEVRYHCTHSSSSPVCTYVWCSLYLVHTGIHSAGAGNADRSFIPNDTVLGVKENEGSRCCLVSGPNMGGKSTLLRQVCMNVIMAQLGVYVPASICRMTIVDRIFTRIGAHDLIMHGQSTFLVELMETASILQGATRQSLVILDELGRGTSTFDGTAIAYSVMKYLNSIDVDCLTLFSTHYHMLMEEFKDCKSISMYHMACKVNENAVKVESSNSSERTPDVTFLYKFLKGSCPKSYGMNVAKLAGLPPSLVSRAQHMSESFERRLEQAHNIGGSRPPPAKKLKLEASESAGKVKMLVDLLDRLLSSPSIK